MSVAKVSEIIASSPKSFEDAINEGIKRASKTLKNVKGPGSKIRRSLSKRARSWSIASPCA